MPERWFKIKGQQAGDRTLEEQMQGLAPALSETPGRKVLDLGCAEGLIGREFSRAGAASVHGIERLERHVELARKLCADLPMTFLCADLGVLAGEHMALEAPRQYDIVLALAVLHKLEAPAIGVKFCAWSCRDLVVMRHPAYSRNNPNVLLSKHHVGGRCNVPATMAEQGFRLEKTLPGPRKEPVQYWRRIR